MSFVKCLKINLLFNMGKRPLYISHKPMCMYHDLGNERNQKFMLSPFHWKCPLVNWFWSGLTLLGWKPENNIWSLFSLVLNTSLILWENLRISIRYLLAIFSFSHCFFNGKLIICALITLFHYNIWDSLSTVRACAIAYLHMSRTVSVCLL